MEASAAALRLTLSDVASLAKVQRPVVSMWRKRSAGTGIPFPAPIAQAHGQEIFDADAIGEWLLVSGRGNNPDARADSAAFARISLQSNGITPDNGQSFDGLTALLALKVLTGVPLSGLSREDLLDAADEHDPDDECLYSELENLGTDLPRAAANAERLAESAYGASAAFEQLLSDRFRSGPRDYATTALTESAIDLLASSAVELAATLDGAPAFSDPTPGGSDLLLGIVRRLPGYGSSSFFAADDGGTASRLTRRRFLVHGHECGRLSAEGLPSPAGPVVHVAQYPSPGNPGISAMDTLLALENTILNMDDSQRAVFLAPASTLCDHQSDPAESMVRSALLRTGRVRAIVRLPLGLLRSKPREAQALWVLGPSFADVSIADRWTMLADLSAQKLTDDVRQDLISDVAASMGRRATIRAHSFRFARLMPTRSLLASRGSLVALASRSGDDDAAGGAEAALRIEELQNLLMKHDGGVPAPVSVLAQSGGRLAPATVQELISGGNLRYVKGNRLDPADLSPGERTRVIGAAELLDPHHAPQRRISLLDFTAGYPSGRLTEPGDVVFCTSPRPAAIVDADGGSVVVFPARVLRLDRGDPGGLVPAVVAADINAATEQDKDWRQWRLRRTPDRQRHGLESALAQLQHAQHQARQRLDQLNELATLILDGVAGGSLALDPVLTTADSSSTAVPNEGTP